MPEFLARDAVRRVDALAIERYGYSGLVLMENAGRGTADVIEEKFLAAMPGHKPLVVIFCGVGNNAGDGFVIARHLDLRGYEVAIILLAPPEKLAGDALHNFRLLEKTGVKQLSLHGKDFEGTNTALQNATVLVDALLGTGATGALRSPYDIAVSLMTTVANELGVPVVAVDLPTGLDADTGEPGPMVVHAAVTCTFVAKKQGFSNPAAKESTGEVVVLDIGVPESIVSEAAAEAAATD